MHLLEENEFEKRGVIETGRTVPETQTTPNTPLPGYKVARSGNAVGLDALDDDFTKRAAEKVQNKLQ